MPDPGTGGATNDSPPPEEQPMATRVTHLHKLAERRCPWLLTGPSHDYEVRRVMMPPWRIKARASQPRCWLLRTMAASYLYPLPNTPPEDERWSSAAAAEIA